MLFMTYYYFTLKDEKNKSHEAINFSANGTRGLTYI